MSRRPRGRERDRRGGPLILTILLLLLLIGSVFTVVLVFDSLAQPGPSDSACHVSGGQRRFSLSPEQAGNAALIIAVGTQRRLPERALTIAVATAMQESSLRNLDHGDRDSLGLFQQRPSQGWGTSGQVMDPQYAAGRFYDRLQQVPDYLDLPLTEAAQTVQRSAFGDLYAQHEPLATALTGALTGSGHGTLWCRLPAAQGAAASGEPNDHAAFTRLLERDHPGLEVTSAPGGRLRLDAGDLDCAWALAQWTVATADESRILEVDVDSVRWQRDGWEPVDSTTDQSRTGLVTVR